MPFADPEKRLQNAKRWRDEKMKKGYGKALYARRAQRYRNEEILRETMEAIVEVVTERPALTAEEKLSAIYTLADEALAFAPPIGKPIEYMPKENHESEQ